SPEAGEILGEKVAFFTGIRDGGDQIEYQDQDPRISSAVACRARQARADLQDGSLLCSLTARARRACWSAKRLSGWCTAVRQTRWVPSPACGGGLGWGHLSLRLPASSRLR